MSETARMEWGRSEVIGLARQRCMHCLGTGMRNGRSGGSGQPCNCVFRSIFRACYNRFRECAAGERHFGRVRLEHVGGGRERRCNWGMKDEEYMADFMLIARRSLSEEDFRLFRFHFLLGADWKLCCRQLKIDRGRFFHAVYGVQRRLGRVFRELQPYGLFPLDEYFSGALRGVRACVPLPAERPLLKPPLRKAA